MRISPTESHASRRDQEFLTLNHASRREREKNVLQSRALRRDSDLLSTF